MRILGFSKKWGKLKRDEFTTFRYPRKDADKGREWHKDEIVKVVYHPRHEGEVLGVAQIISIEPKEWYEVTEWEARADGFDDSVEMWQYLKRPVANEEFNKLTLKWIEHPVA